MFGSGLPHIPHVGVKADYQSILSGKGLRVLTDAVLGADVDTGEGDDAMLAIEGPVANNSPVVEEESGDDERMEAIEAALYADGAEPVESGDNECMDAIEARLYADGAELVLEDGPHVSEPSPVEGVPVELVSEEGVPVDTDVVLNVGSRVTLMARLDVRGTTWGAFRITPVDAGPFGSFQIQCPFHKKSGAIGCKKKYAMTGPSVEDAERVLCRLMWWACQAHDFNRQRLHILSEVGVAPPYIVIKGRIIEDKPIPGTIVTDVELDAAGTSITDDMPLLSLITPVAPEHAGEESDRDPKGPDSSDHEESDKDPMGPDSDDHEESDRDPMGPDSSDSSDNDSLTD